MAEKRKLLIPIAEEKTAFSISSLRNFVFLLSWIYTTPNSNSTAFSLYETFCINAAFILKSTKSKVSELNFRWSPLFQYCDDQGCSTCSLEMTAKIFIQIAFVALILYLRIKKRDVDPDSLSILIMSYIKTCRCFTFTFQKIRNATEKRCTRRKSVVHGQNVRHRGCFRG